MSQAAERPERTTAPGGWLRLAKPLWIRTGRRKPLLLRWMRWGGSPCPSAWHGHLPCSDYAGHPGACLNGTFRWFTPRAA